MMKITIYTFLLMGFASCGVAQNNSDIPEAVMSNFEATYPNASDIEWETNANGFNVEFDDNRTEYEVWFDAAGRQIKSVQEIQETELPQPVRQRIASDYAGYQADDFEKWVENSEESYQVDLEKGEKELKVRFASNGGVKEELAD